MGWAVRQGGGGVYRAGRCSRVGGAVGWKG